MKANACVVHNCVCEEGCCFCYLLLCFCVLSWFFSCFIHAFFFSFEGASLLLCNFVRLLLLLLLLVQRRHGRRRRRRRGGDRHCSYCFFFLCVCRHILRVSSGVRHNTWQRRSYANQLFFFLQPYTFECASRQLLFLFVLWDTNSAFRRKKGPFFLFFLFFFSRVAS